MSGPITRNTLHNDNQNAIWRSAALLQTPLPLLLWVDFVSGQEDPTLRHVFAQHFRVVHVNRLDQIDQMVADLHPTALCFDYDYPLDSQLATMRNIKRKYAGLPILMMTVEHSEALAVWSFRMRVWNYLVKPVPPQEMRANLQVMARIASLGPKQRRAMRLRGPAMAMQGKDNRAIAAYQAVLPALEHVQLHYREPIVAAEIARLCGMTSFRFSREFRAALGRTFQDHVLRFRVAEACRLIKKVPATPIAYIGSAVGFNDTSYFARIFKRYVNMRPSEFATCGAGDYHYTHILPPVTYQQSSASQTPANVPAPEILDIPLAPVSGYSY